MAYKIKTEESSHWYDRSGNSMHTVPKKSSKTGETRNIGRTACRERVQMPAVAEALGIVANEGLVRWKMGQVAYAATQIARQDGDDDETFADRIVLNSMNYTREAADFGELMHSAIEDYLLTGHTPDQLDVRNDKVEEFWGPVREWLDANIESVVASEYTVVSSVGYAGRVDLKVRLKGEARMMVCAENDNAPLCDGLVILDFKTRNPALNGQLLSYDKELWQGSAYSAADPDTHRHNAMIPFCNLYIGSKEPGNLRFKAYSTEEMNNGTAFFGHALQMWVLMKGYDPSF